MSMINMTINMSMRMTINTTKMTTATKVIHTVGAVGRVEWRDLGGHNYSGIFKGAQHGLVRCTGVLFNMIQRYSSSRLSLALEPDTEKLTTAPGMGLKFLRDGMDSANLVAMYSVDGQESWNFFKNDFSNHIPESGWPLFTTKNKVKIGSKNLN